MTFNLDTIQSIMRGHQEILNDLQDQLSQLSCDDQIIQTIQNRQQTMRECHEIYLQRKLNIFSMMLRRHSTNKEAGSLSSLSEQSIIDLYNNYCFSTIY